MEKFLGIAFACVATAYVAVAIGITGVTVGWYNVLPMLVLVLLAVGLYFLPTIVATRRGHDNRLAIGVLNLLAGWTFVGWVAALVWACTSNPRPVTT